MLGGRLRIEAFAAASLMVISFPEGLSADSVEDLDDYIQVFLKKARREAGAVVRSELYIIL
jgi:hypothetical protein